MMMNGYYDYTNTAFNEAQNNVKRMNVDDLKRLMNNDDELTSFVQNLSEVGEIFRSVYSWLFFSFRI